MTFDATFFDRGVDRLNTQCEKWDHLRQREGDDVLPMWVADMDFESPPAVVDALVARAQRLTYGYTAATPCDLQAYVDFWQRRHQLRVDPSWHVSLPCVVTGLRRCVLTMSAPGERIVIQPPVYGPFFSAITDNDRVIAENPLLLTPDGYKMDLEGLEALLRDGCKLVMLCNPHNPTGRCWSREELAALLSLCRRYGARIVSDEIHADFVFAPKTFTPILALPGAEECCVSLTAPSKTFNIAGLQKSSLLVPDASLREAFVSSMNKDGIVCDNIFSLVAARAAYEHGDAWLDGLKDYLATSRQIVMDFMRDRLPHIGVSALEATYLVWLDCRSLNLTDEELRTRTLREGKIALTGGDFFGTQGKGFLRLNIGCPHAQLRDALTRLEKALHA